MSLSYNFKTRRVTLSQTESSSTIITNQSDNDMSNQVTFSQSESTFIMFLSSSYNAMSGQGTSANTINKSISDDVISENWHSVWQTQKTL